MAKKPVIIFENVTKTFFINRQRKIKHQFLNFQKKSKKKFIALKNINFKVFEGEVIGIYGPNGSGKTTILKLAAEIIKPDNGKVFVKGKIAPVLELGVGLHPELSGAENINLYGSILGVSRRLIKSKFQEIIKFSELSEFINTPVKKYSTGMKARLSFAIAYFSDADIFLLDEALSVGDVDFREKCIEAVKKIKGKKTIVFTSHNFGLMQRVCDRMIHVQNGKIIRQSDSKLYHFLKRMDDGCEFVVEAVSNSMWPLIDKGDEVLIKKIPYEKLTVGDVIAFNFENTSELIVHRIVKKLEDDHVKYLTKGDLLVENDPWVLMKENYIGKVKDVQKF
jgi:ABC-2 type transport system ATP-binding protein